MSILISSYGEFFMALYRTMTPIYNSKPTTFICPECKSVEWKNKGYFREEDLYCSFCRGDYLDYNPILSERKRVLARLRSGKKAPKLIPIS